MQKALGKMSCLAAMVVLASMVCSTSATAGGDIIHRPVYHVPEGDRIQIETDLATTAAQVSLYYRLPGDPAFRVMDMAETVGGRYVAVLSDAKLKKGDAFDYYIVAEKTDGRVVTFPEMDAELMPVHVVVSEKRLIQESGIEAVVLSPEEGASVAKGDFMVAVSFFADSIDVKKLRLMVDGDDVTKKADVTAELLTYSDKGIAPGPHTVRVWYAVNKEEIYKLAEWSFQVTPEATEDVFAGKGFSGVTAAGGEGAARDRFEDGKFRANFRTEYKGQKNLGVTTDYGRVGADVSYEKRFFMLSGSFDFDSQDDPRKNQALTRYQVSGNFDDVVLLNYGDTYPVFSPLTLYGTRVRGFSGGVYLGVFNLEFVQGEVNRKVISKGDERSLDRLDSLYDAVIAAGDNADSAIVAALNQNSLNRFTGTFKRNLLGARFSIGPQSFQFGISATKVKDDQGSLNYNAAKAIAFSGIKPQENVVAGLDFKMNLFNKRLQFDASAATGFTNTDITGGSLKASVFEDAGFTGFNQSDIDFISNFITVNTNLTPVPVNGISDQNLYAYTFGGTVNAYNNNFMARYRHHGGYFQSLATSIQRDIESFEISDRFRMWQNRLFLTVSYATSQNNLAKRNTNTLETTNLGFQVALFVPQYPTLTLGYNAINRDNGFTTDSTGWTTATNAGNPGYKFKKQIDGKSLPEDNATNVFYINTSHLFFISEYRNNVSLNVSRSIKDDKSRRIFLDGPAAYYAGPSDNQNTTIGLTFSTEWKIPLRTTVVFSTTSGESDLHTGTGALDTVTTAKSSAVSYGVSADYVALDKKDLRMNLFGGVILSSVDVPSAAKTTLTSFTLGDRFNFYKRHTILLNFQLTTGLKIPKASGGTKSVVNQIMTARYEFTF